MTKTRARRALVRLGEIALPSLGIVVVAVALLVMGGLAR
jgi:hypothetical protein